MTKIQSDILFWLSDNGCKVLTFDYVGAEIVAICQMGNALYRYVIAEDGDATAETYTKSHERSCYSWSMEEHDWVKEVPVVKEEPSNESHDVVVENKIKIEKEFKKMARCDFAKIAKEVNRERFRSWVQDNADDLVTYAEDAFAEAYESYMDDNCDEYADVAHEAIDNIIDNLYMGDYTDEVEDAEEVVEDVIM